MPISKCCYYVDTKVEVDVMSTRCNRRVFCTYIHRSIQHRIKQMKTWGHVPTYLLLIVKLKPIDFDFDFNSIKNHSSKGWSDIEETNQFTQKLYLVFLKLTNSCGPRPQNLFKLLCSVAYKNVQEAKNWGRYKFLPSVSQSIYVCVS